MQYIGNIIRPPSEADSIILQVTVGCSYNKCTFCGAYKEQSFAIKSEQVVDEDLQFARSYCRNQKRLFLADGDVLILSQRRLVEILLKIRKNLPWVTKVSLYGNARAVRNKSLTQLQELKGLGLDRIYLGLESGCTEVLDLVQKGETHETMVDAGRKIRQAGLFLSVTALLGLGGSVLSEKHAKETAEALNKIGPNQIAVLTLMILQNSPLGQYAASGDFILPDSQQMLRELHLLISGLNSNRCQFHANHASSYLPLAGRLPRDKDVLLRTIENALAGSVPTVPESWRAL